MRELHPEIKVYSGEDLPDAYAHQIRSFIRYLWFDIYQYQLDPPIAQEHLHPIYVVMVEGDALYSATGLYWVTVEHEGQTYKLYGLGDVLTYPAFRKKGYGSALIRKATDIMRDDPDADIGLLWTQEHNFSFYENCGWERMPDVTITHGEKDQPDIEEEMPFMLFFSDRAKANRANFSRSPLYIGPDRW